MDQNVDKYRKIAHECLEMRVLRLMSEWTRENNIKNEIQIIENKLPSIRVCYKLVYRTIVDKIRENKLKRLRTRMFDPKVGYTKEKKKIYLEIIIIL